MNVKISIILLFLCLNACTNSKRTTLNTVKSQKSPYVILISVDGLRHDYIKKYNPPTLSKIKENGLAAESLIPIFPSKTFPNHYSIVTGMYAENHGLISNSFYDPNLKKTYSLGNREAVENGVWYDGEPIWITAKKNNMVSASYFWVGSEANIKGMHPDYYLKYDHKIPGETRVDKVIEWLELPADERPHFITLYFSEVDSAGHDFGPNSKEVKTALFNVDDYINRLSTKIKKFDFPINIIIVSDQGMTEISNKHKVILPSEIENNPKINIVGKGALSLIYIKDNSLIQSTYENLKNINGIDVYLKKDIPANYHFKNNSRIPEIIISPKMPYYIAAEKKNIQGGTHGYDPINKDMHGIFMAIGPNIKSQSIKSFENIHIYPFITKLLGINYDHQIDGDPSVLNNFLK